jgi:hypothetical protein
MKRSERLGMACSEGENDISILVIVGLNVTLRGPSLLIGESGLSLEERVVPPGTRSCHIIHVPIYIKKTRIYASIK